MHCPTQVSECVAGVSISANASSAELSGIADDGGGIAPPLTNAGWRSRGPQMLAAAMKQCRLHSLHATTKRRMVLVAARADVPAVAAQHPGTDAAVHTLAAAQRSQQPAAQRPAALVAQSQAPAPQSPGGSPAHAESPAQPPPQPPAGTPNPGDSPKDVFSQRFQQEARKLGEDLPNRPAKARRRFKLSNHNVIVQIRMLSVLPVSYLFSACGRNGRSLLNGPARATCIQLSL